MKYTCAFREVKLPVERSGESEPADGRTNVEAPY